MKWLLDLLFDAVKEMCSQFIIDMMDIASNMFTEILSCDLDLFEELFGVAGDLYRSVIMPVAIMLLLMILVWQLFKSMFGKLGASSEDPLELVFRSTACLFFITFAKDIVNYILDIMGTPYQWVVGTAVTVDSFSGYVSAAEAAVSLLGVDTMSIQILLLIMHFVVAWNYFKVLFILAERYVLLGVFSYTAPLAFATGGSKATNNVLGSWAKMFGGQVLIVILDAWSLKMFLSGYGNLMASGYGFTKFFAATMCLIGFCKIIGKLDSYMASLGVNLGRTGGGMSGIGALMMAGRLFHGGGKSGGHSEKADAGHMSFGTGKPIPMGKGGPDFQGAGMAGIGASQGSGIGGMDMEQASGDANAGGARNQNRGWDEEGFGAVDFDGQDLGNQNMPFGTPDGMDSSMPGAPEDGADYPQTEGAGEEADVWRSTEGLDDNGESWNPDGMEPFMGDYGGTEEPFGQAAESYHEADEMDSGMDMEDAQMESGFGVSGLESEGALDLSESNAEIGDSVAGMGSGVGEAETNGSGIPAYTDGDIPAEPHMGSPAENAGGSVSRTGTMGETVPMSGHTAFSGSEGAENAGTGAESYAGTHTAGSQVAGYGESHTGAESSSAERTGSGTSYGAEDSSGSQGVHAAGTGFSTEMGTGEKGYQTDAAQGRTVPESGSYLAERDGEGYMRYDSSMYAKPEGSYQTIHENGKNYYELPEGEKAPAVLPETKAVLEKSGSIRLEKVQKEIQSGQAPVQEQRPKKKPDKKPGRRPGPAGKGQGGKGK